RSFRGGGDMRWLDDHVWVAVGTRGVVVGQRLPEDQRVAEGEVEVNRAGPGPGGGRVGAAGQRPDPAQPPRCGLVVAHLEEPPDGVAVELQLIDRLAGADVSQLRWTISGQDD